MSRLDIFKTHAGFLVKFPRDFAVGNGVNVVEQKKRAAGIDRAARSTYNKIPIGRSRPGRPAEAPVYRGFLFAQIVTHKM
jgi:hypothetical protein